MSRKIKITLATIGLAGCFALAGPYAPSNSNWPSTFSVFQGIAPLTPAPQSSNYPLGNDLWLKSFGSADLHSQNWSINLTSTTSVVAGSHTVTVGTTSSICPSSATASANCITLSASTAELCRPSVCGLVVDPDAASAEVIAAGNWSIASASTLTATFANTHTQPYKIRQIGAQYIDSRTISLNSGDVADRPVVVQGRSGNVLATVTNDTSGTFPKSALQMQGVVTGANGGNSNLAYRNNTSSSCFQILNAANTGVLGNFCETASAALFTFGNATNNSMKLQAAADIARLYGGGTSTGLILYPVQSGTGTNGTIRIRNNPTDDTEVFNVDTSTGLLTLGSNSLGALRCNNTTCGGTVTLSTGTGTATVVSGCRPICTDTTANASVKCAVSSTTLTATGTGSDVIDYFCF